MLRYLLEEIPPCTSIAGSDRNPCAVQPVPAVDVAATSSEFLEVPRYWQFFPDGPLMFIPHLVIRGTFLTNTTRCKPYERGFPAYANFSMRSNNRLALCFTEARVSDYLIGKGPPQLTVIVHAFNYAVPYVEPGSTVTINENDWVNLEELRSEASAAYEGVEGVMFLTPSPTTVVEAWWVREFWDVQQKGDTVVVVAPYKEVIETWYRERIAIIEDGVVGEPLFTEEDVKLLERPLSEFETAIKEGAVARVAETGGRIAVGDDLPMLITDANLLRPYYEGPGVGISYETDAPLLPPPIPGTEDSDQPPATTGGEDDDPSDTVPTPGAEDQEGDGDGTFPGPLGKEQ